MIGMLIENLTSAFSLCMKTLSVVEDYFLHCCEAQRALERNGCGESWRNVECGKAPSAHKLTMFSACCSSRRCSRALMSASSVRTRSSSLTRARSTCWSWDCRSCSLEVAWNSFCSENKERKDEESVRWEERVSD